MNLATMSATITAGMVTNAKADPAIVGATPFSQLVQTLIADLLAMIQGCVPAPASAASVHERLNSPGLLDAAYLRIETRQAFATRAAFLQYGASLQIEAKKAALALSVDDIGSLMVETAAM